MSWNYQQAFSRHEGIFTTTAQQRIKTARVAIAGLGGVGGVHLIALVRMGFERFTIADPDTYELANINRQYGAKISTIGHSKAEVMAAEARAINPNVDIRLFKEPISGSIVDTFLDDTDIFVDGIDFFEIDSRQQLFRSAHKRGIWAISAGPHAFGTAWLIFSPRGISFDDYFDLSETMSTEEKLFAFAVGCVPKPIHLRYVDLAKYFRFGERTGASIGAACFLAAGVVATQVAKIVLDHQGVRPAPHYYQFDAYLQRLVHGRIYKGNQNPWRRLRRRLIAKQLGVRFEAGKRSLSAHVDAHVSSIMKEQQ